MLVVVVASSVFHWLVLDMEETSHLSSVEANIYCREAPSIKSTWHVSACVTVPRANTRTILIHKEHMACECLCDSTTRKHENYPPPPPHRHHDDPSTYTYRIVLISSLFQSPGRQKNRTTASHKGNSTREKGFLPRLNSKQT